MNKAEHPNSLFCCQHWEWEQPNNPDQRMKCLLQPQLQLANADIVSVAKDAGRTLSGFHTGLTFWPAKINFDQTGGINWF